MDDFTANLTAKQARFVEQYLIDLNGTQAAIRAGFRKHTAHQAAYELLRKPEIIAAIEAAKLARSERTQVDADWVLKRLADEADADMADLYDDDGDLLPVEDWPLIWRQGLVAGVDIEALYADGEEGEGRKIIGHVKKLKLVDRTRRLELIGKHVKVNAFQETVELKGLNALADRLERAQKRLDSEEA
ncbi:terminase small subunit [Rhizobium sp. RMa-01]|uniref:terminase small subunit n=1 Tax=unclassified Rhizobium TaxID=2613769 RepID=UPI0008D93233|nr:MULTISPECIES: terminase small subunit [unclassified Rhizobium]OHV24933.1 terminase [Rhizobium sp. RSm-3]RVU08359.1 terminase small subunit [Rhizobium sp. RMa-01]